CPTSTPTPTPGPKLVGHVSWQGRGAQPGAGQIMPISLTLKLGGVETDYSYQLTDAYGFFTVTVALLPPGAYNWRAKGPTYLATAGRARLTAGSSSQEMGLQKTGDLNGDNVCSIQDFTLLSGNFGQSGAPPILPGGR